MLLSNRIRRLQACPRTNPGMLVDTYDKSVLPYTVLHSAAELALSSPYSLSSHRQ